MRERDRYDYGYIIEVKPVKKGGSGDFWGGVVICILALALFGWLFGY